MARQYELSWIPALKQWRKVVKGKQYYLGTGKGKGDMVGYAKALAKWNEIQLGLADNKKREFIERKKQQWKTLLEPYEHSGTVPEIALKRPEYFTEQEYVELTAKHNLPVQPTKPDGEKTVGDFIDQYLAVQQERYEHGLQFPDAPRSERISGSRLLSYRWNIETVRDVWGNDTRFPMTESELAQKMIAFRQSQKELLTQRKIKPGTFNERIKTLRHFVGFLHTNYLVTALPRNLREICGRYRVGESSARALDLATIKTLWNEGNDRMKLYIALGLNCGFYAVDIASLKLNEIQGNYIHYNRHKTGIPIRYKLWQVTKNLLNKLKGKGKKGGKANGLVLFAKDGITPLLVIDPDAKKGKRWCEIESDLAALKKRLGIKGVSFSNFRDTSSTKIEGINPQLTDLFDGHKDGRMATFYIDKNKVDMDELFAPLDAAIDQLEEFYGLQS